MGIAVLGPLAIDGQRTALAPRDRVVLAALIVRHGEVVDASVLADALWRDDPPSTWTKQIQASIMRLRRSLGTGAIQTVSSGYRLAVAANEIDTQRFEHLYARARELGAMGAPDRAAHLMGEALALWRGQAFTDLDGWEPGRIEAHRLERLRLDAEEARVDAALGAGQHVDVLAAAAALVAEEPLRARRWELLALAQYRSGQQSDALRTLREARHRLAEELGLDPGPALTTLEQAILRHEPSLAGVPSATEPSAECPYRGLVPYDTTDAETYFGRDVELSECLRRLGEAGALVVVGPSGSGKSSLVRAGVAAALERSGRRVAVITPGARPMNALGAAAPTFQHPAGVLVVDQCEEAIALCPDPDEQARFFAALANVRGPLVVVLRADRLGALSSHPAFARLVERGLYVLKAMDDDGLRAVVEGPARRAGLLVEPGLAELLVRESRGEPGALPLLSHALAETWAHREGRTLTVAGYDASGGIHGAVARSAESVYEQVVPEQRPIMRDLLLRLIIANPDGLPVRTRMPRRLVAQEDGYEQVIELLVGARLVTSDDGVVELAHESLARAWPRLRDWLDDDAEGQRLWRQLSLAADTWETMGRPDTELIRGTRLGQTLDWRERAAPALSTAERDFLDASRRHAEAERHAARRRRRIAIVALSAGVVVATALAAIAVVSQRHARDEAERADAAAARARSSALAASAVTALDDDPSLAKLLAVASAVGVEPTIASSAALHQAWVADGVRFRHGTFEFFGARWSDIDPAGGRLVVGGSDPVNGSGQLVEVVDVASGTTAWKEALTDASAWAGTPLFVDDGTKVVAGVFWHPYNSNRLPAPLAVDAPVEEPPPRAIGARVWDAASGELVEQFDLGRCGGLVTAASDHHLLARTLRGSPDAVTACNWTNGTVGVELVDRRSGARQVLTDDAGAVLSGAALSADGRVVAFDDAAANGDLVVIDVASGTELLRLALPADRTTWGVRALDADGTRLLVGDQPIEVWDVAAGERIAAFDGHDGSSDFAAFSPSGTVLSSSGDTLREWTAGDGREVWSYPRVGNGRVATTPSGLILVSNIIDNTSSIIDRRRRGEVADVQTCPGRTPADSLRIVGDVAVFHIICAGDGSATTYVVDAPTGRVINTITGQQGPALALSPDGRLVVRQEGDPGGDGPLAVRDVRSGAKLLELDGRADRLRWSPDGTMIAVAAGADVSVWDATTGALLYADQPDPSRIKVTDVMFTPDSTALIATSDDQQTRFFSTSSWDIERSWGAKNVGLIGFTPDGARALVAGGFLAGTDPTLVWHDVVTATLLFAKEDMPEASLRSVALSPDGTLVATASSDGVVRVWDGPTLDLLHEIPLGDTPLQGVAFVTNEHLAVTPEDGDLLVVTTDAAELLDVVRSSLSRGFTGLECGRFDFGERCPTLAELGVRPAGATDPAELNGTYDLQFSADDLTDSLNGPVPLRLDVPPNERNIYIGTYTVTFDDGRFDIEQHGTKSFCSGSYTIVEDRVRMVAERTGETFDPPACGTNTLFLDAAFELTDDGLRLADASGNDADLMLFTRKELARVD